VPVYHSKKGRRQPLTALNYNWGKEAPSFAPKGEPLTLVPGKSWRSDIFLGTFLIPGVACDTKENAMTRGGGERIVLEKKKKGLATTEESGILVSQLF